MRQLLDQVEQITKEQNYQRVSEILHLSVTVVSSTIYITIFDLHICPLLHTDQKGQADLSLQYFKTILLHRPCPGLSMVQYELLSRYSHGKKDTLP